MFGRSRILVFSFFIFVSFTARAQMPQSVDKIAAAVGKSNIILASELESQAMQAKQQYADFTDEMKCQILEQMIIQKLMVEQAERDSTFVTEEEVEGTLENRIRYFTGLYGSKEKLEEISGKTVYQLKEDYRDLVRESLLAEKVQGEILQNIKITPAEVQAFYSKIPTDSLPFFPAMVEMGQIVIDPPVNPELDKYTRETLEGYRNEIVTGGKDFEAMAGAYSKDPGSADNGGDLGTVSRKSVVPEFAAAAFKLQNGEISQVVKTKYGYHIIQMVKRKGEDAHLRHILLKPEHVSADFKKATDKLDSVRADLVAGKISFPEAVGKYSTDENSNRTGGMLADPQTGATQMELDKLDPVLALMLDTLKPGNFSAPHIFDAGRGQKSCRIVYLKSITVPHKANLKDDYNKIQEVALQQKKALKMEEWLKEKSPTYYVKVAPEYLQCESLKKWAVETAKNK
jgi:peptidyl-prolyl cis-trans isomerase SurA